MSLDAVHPGARALFGLCALALLGIVIVMIRWNAIKEKYALLWLPLGIGFLLASLFPDLLLKLSARIHLHYMTVVVMAVIVVFTAILLYFTARLSQIREDMKILAQDAALARARTGTGTEKAPEGSGWLPAGKKTPARN